MLPCGWDQCHVCALTGDCLLSYRLILLKPRSLGCEDVAGDWFGTQSNLETQPVRCGASGARRCDAMIPVSVRSSWRTDERIGSCFANLLGLWCVVQIGREARNWTYMWERTVGG
jgi:hypothetical protein